MTDRQAYLARMAVAFEDIPSIPKHLAERLAVYGSLPADEERECDAAIQQSVNAIRRLHGLPVGGLE